MYEAYTINGQLDLMARDIATIKDLCGSDDEPTPLEYDQFTRVRYEMLEILNMLKVRNGQEV